MGKLIEMIYKLTQVFFNNLATQKIYALISYYYTNVLIHYHQRYPGLSRRDRVNFKKMSELDC